MTAINSWCGQLFTIKAFIAQYLRASWIEGKAQRRRLAVAQVTADPGEGFTRRELS
jgi:hypothetical protein